MKNHLLCGQENSYSLFFDCWKKERKEKKKERKKYFKRLEKHTKNTFIFGGKYFLWEDTGNRKLMYVRHLVCILYNDNTMY